MLWVVTATAVSGRVELVMPVADCFYVAAVVMNACTAASVAYKGKSSSSVASRETIYRTTGCLDSINLVWVKRSFDIDFDGHIYV